MCPAAGLCLLLLLLLAAAASADPATEVYRKVDDDVVLKPGNVSGPISSILWKDGLNIAVHWDGTDIEYYRHFNVRSSLNTSSGELTITGLTGNDSGLYTPEINNNIASPTRLTVISPVPKPTVGESCVDETRCILSCEGDTKGAEPITYSWKSGDKVLTGSSKDLSITKENSSSIDEFSCELENPVSRESSKPFPNPFPTIPASAEPAMEGQSLKIAKGLTVFICLLMAVLLPVLYHRWKAGVWFFEKVSMPWEADFWRRQEGPPQDAAQSNGSPAQEEKGLMDEETQLK